MFLGHYSILKDSILYAIFIKCYKKQEFKDLIFRNI